MAALGGARAPATGSFSSSPSAEHRHGDWLPAHGADLAAPGLHEITPLARATSAGQPDAVRTPIELGADINARTKRVETSLDEALLRDDVAELLRQHGAEE